jgi:hypothetical protein
MYSPVPSLQEKYSMVRSETETESALTIVRFLRETEIEPSSSTNQRSKTDFFGFTG